MFDLLKSGSYGKKKIFFKVCRTLEGKHHYTAAWAHLCYSQVRDFKCPICGQQQIPWFNVFVNYSLAVQIFKAI